MSPSRWGQSVHPLPGFARSRRGLSRCGGILTLKAAIGYRFAQDDLRSLRSTICQPGSPVLHPVRHPDNRSEAAPIDHRHCRARAHFSCPARWSCARVAAEAPPGANPVVNRGKRTRLSDQPRARAERGSKARVRLPRRRDAAVRIVALSNPHDCTGDGANGEPYADRDTRA